MYIHRVKRGESLGEIAQGYGISRDIAEVCNGLRSGERLAEGEELLILTPTRTYTARRADTPERLSMRFGIRHGELLSMNPGMCRGIREGDRIILNYDVRTHGMAASNGYFFAGCDRDMLKRALPYATYVSVAEGVVVGDEVRSLFSSGEVVRIINEGERVPLLRIYDGGDSARYRDKEFRKRIIERMIEAAVGGGYKGITLGGCMLGDGDAGAEFTVELRGRMIGCDLILIAEMNDRCDPMISELADGSVFFYDKYREAEVGFDDGERRVLSKFACEGESSRTFLDLPAFAAAGAGFITMDEAMRLARRRSAVIERSEDSLTCSFECGRCGRIVYHSLENIKARLDIISELGFMGISFDIARTPISHLLMYNALYKTVGTTPVRSREGCSRGYGE